MAALNELIEKIENPELRAQIQAAADRLVKQKKFGLVFEEHTIRSNCRRVIVSLRVFGHLR